MKFVILKAPVPFAVFVRSLLAASVNLRATMPVTSGDAMYRRNGAEADLSSKRTVRSSTLVTALSMRIFVRASLGRSGFMMRLKVKSTSSTVRVDPSWNFTPSRIVKVYDVALSCFQAVASEGNIARSLSIANKAS